MVKVWERPTTGKHIDGAMDPSKKSRPVSPEPTHVSLRERFFHARNSVRAFFRLKAAQTIALLGFAALVISFLTPSLFFSKLDADAGEKVLVFASNCDGDWFGADRVSKQPELSPNDYENLFTVENSAFWRGGFGAINCSGFELPSDIRIAKASVGLSLAIRTLSEQKIIPPQTQPPRLSASVVPSSAPQGTVFTLQGNGFTPNATVTSYLQWPDGTLFSPITITTDEEGSYSHDIESEGFIPGTYKQWTVDDTTEESSSAFLITITETKKEKPEQKNNSLPKEVPGASVEDNLVPEGSLNQSSDNKPAAFLKSVVSSLFANAQEISEPIVETPQQEEPVVVEEPLLTGEQPAENIIVQDEPPITEENIQDTGSVVPEQPQPVAAPIIAQPELTDAILQVVASHGGKNRTVLGFINKIPFSNGLNGGYPTFILPQEYINAPDLEVGVESVRADGTTVEILVDSIFLSLEVQEPLEVDLVPVDHEDRQLRKGVFAPNDKASFFFKVRDPKKPLRDSLVDWATNPGPPENIHILAEIHDSNDMPVLDAQFGASWRGRGAFGAEEWDIKVKAPPELRPGRYTLLVRFVNADGTSTDIEHEFLWGVLAINTAKSIYLPEETVDFAFAVLDEEGNMVCNAKLTLNIETPWGHNYTLSTDDNTIVLNEECQQKSATQRPDYEAHWKLPGRLIGQQEEGVYSLKLSTLFTNKNGETESHEIQDAFEVHPSVPFDVHREGPTRIFPQQPYQMTFTVRANDSFEGKITEPIPSSFEIVSQTQFEKIGESDKEISLRNNLQAPQKATPFWFNGIKEVFAQEAEENISSPEPVEDVQTEQPQIVTEQANNLNNSDITWNVSFEAGSIYKATYLFDAPDISPEFWLLGPLRFTSLDADSNLNGNAPQPGQEAAPENVTGQEGEAQTEGSSGEPAVPAAPETPADENPLPLSEPEENLLPVIIPEVSAQELETTLFEEIRQWQIASDALPKTGVKTGSFTKRNGTGSQSIDGLGFKPKAIIFSATNKTAEGTSNTASGAALSYGLGFTTGASNERAIAVWEEGQTAGGATDNGRAQYNNASIVIAGLNGGLTFGIADLTSFDPNGFTLNWSVSDANAYIIQYYALSENLISNAIAESFTFTTGTGNLSINNAGFQPDFVLMMTLGSTTHGSNIAEDTWSIGAATSSTTEWTVSGRSDDAVDSSDTCSVQRTNASLYLIGTAATCATTTEDAVSDFTQFTSSGFDINKSNAPAANFDFYYLALKANAGVSWAVGSDTKPTSATTDTVSGLSFQPTGLFHATRALASSSTLDAQSYLSVGATSGPSNEWSAGFSMADATDASDPGSTTTTNKIVRVTETDAETLTAEADLVSLDSTGFTFNYTTSDGTADEYLYWAVGSSARYPKLTYEGYTFENDDEDEATGDAYDENTAQAGAKYSSAGANYLTNVKKGERIVLRSQIKNTGTEKLDNIPLSLFYDRNDNIWTKVERGKPVTTAAGNCTDTNYDCATIDDTGTARGEYTSIAFDQSSNPWISYYDATTSALMVARYVGTGGTGCTSTAWNCEQVDNTGTDKGRWTDITISAFGRAWVSYYDVTTAALMVAQYVGTGGSGCTSTLWTCETVDNTGTDTGQYTSIVVDTLGSPWVSYYDVTNSALRVATRGGGWTATACTDTDWSCDAVANADDDGKYSSIGISPSNQAWVSYYQDGALDRLAVAQFVGGTSGGCTSTAWVCEVVDDTGTITGLWTALSFGSDGVPWVSFYDSTNTSLRVATRGTAQWNPTGTCTDTDWECAAVDNSTDVGEYTSIAFDAAGMPQVAYYENFSTSCDNSPATECSLRVARLIGGSSGSCTDTAWNCGAVENQTSTGNIGQYTSVASGLDGNLWVSYYDVANTALKFANIKRGGEITVARGMGAKGGDALSESHADMTSATDTTGRDDADCLSGSTTWNAGKFIEGEEGTVALPIGSTTAQCTEVSFVIGTSQANPGATYRLLLASQDNWREGKGVWRGVISVAANCGSGANEDCRPKLTIESDSTSSIRYSKDNQAKFADCTDTTWGCAAVDDDANTQGQYTSMAVDSSGKVWVSYYDVTATALMVAEYVGSGGSGCGGAPAAWTCTTVDNTGTDRGQYTSITIDSQGNPWVSYYNVTDSALMVAAYVGSGGAGCTSTAWNCETVDNTGTDTGRYTSIALDPGGTPWVSFYDVTNTSLRIAARGPVVGAACTDVDWTCNVIDNDTDDTGQYSSLAFGSGGVAWVSYYDATAFNLSVASYVGSGGSNCGASGSAIWNCEIVDDVGATAGVGRYTSIAFAPDGNAWISYQDVDNADLKVANRVSSGGSGCTGATNSTLWICTTVDAATTLGLWTSIAFDASGNAWVVYYNDDGTATNKALKVAYYDGDATSSGCNVNAWTCATVDASGSDAVGEYASIAFDSSGAPWVAYYDGTTELSLRVAKLHLPFGKPTPATTISFAARSAKRGDARYRLDRGKSPSTEAAGTCSATADREGYCGVTTDDTQYDSMTAAAAERPMFVFVQEHSNASDLPNVDWVINTSKACSSKNVVLQIYRFGTTNAWETIVTNSTCSVSTDTAANDSQPSGTLTEYFETIGSEYFVYYRIYQVEDSSATTLKIEYFNGTPTTPPGITVSGSTNVTGQPRVRVAVGTSLQAQTATAAAGPCPCAWSIAGVGTPAGGAIVTVFLDETDGDIVDGSESTAVTKYSGAGNVTGFQLDANVLSIGTNGTYAEQSMSVADIQDKYDTDQDEDVMHTVNTSVIDVEGLTNSYSDETIRVEEGDTLTVSGTDTLGTHNLTVDDAGGGTDGILTASGAATFNVSGSWTNKGDYNSGSETVTFAMESSETIDMTGSSDAEINNIIVNGSSQTLQVNSAVTILNDLTMTAGTLQGTNSVTVNGSVAGTGGDINLTGGTFEQRVGAAENFGSTSGTAAWVFNNLTFSNSNADTSTDYTVTTQNNSGDSVTVSVVLRIGGASDTGGNDITLTGADRIWILAGSATPFVITDGSDTFTANSSTVRYTSGSPTNITSGTAATYNNLELTPGSGATYTPLSGTITVNTDFTVNNNTTVAADTNNTNFIVNRHFVMNSASVWTKGSGTFTFAGSTTPVNWTDGNGTKQDIGTVIIGTGSAKQVDMTTAVTVTTVTVAASATLNSNGSNTLTIMGTGTVFDMSGADRFTESAGTVDYKGNGAVTVTATTYNNLTLSPAITVSNRTYTAGGAITISGNLDINPSSGSVLNLDFDLAGATVVSGSTTVRRTTSATSNLDTVSAANPFTTQSLDLQASGTLTANDATITLTGTGTPFTLAADTFVEGSSTFDYTGQGATNITNTTYWHLRSVPAANGHTHTLGTGASQTVTASGNMTVGNGANTVTVRADSNNAILDVLGNFTVAASGTFTASDSASFSVAGSWANSASGTFNRGLGTVTFDDVSGDGQETIADGGDPFYAIIFNGSGGDWLYTDGASTATNSTTMQLGSATLLNVHSGTRSVTGGTLIQDWYLSVHAVDRVTPSTNIDTVEDDSTNGDVIVSEVGSNSTIYLNGGPAWGTADVTKRTGSAASGHIPQPNNSGAIRLREYSMTNSGTCPGAGCTLYRYNLEIEQQNSWTYGEYDYHDDYGLKYITSCLANGSTCSNDTTNDDVIGDLWYRSTIGTENSHPTLNEPPTTGTWYAGLLSGLLFSLDSLSVSLGDLNAGNNFTSQTGTTTTTVSTSGSLGYNIVAWVTQLLTRIGGAETIPAWGGTNASPTVWTGNCITNSECGFGYNTNDAELTQFTNSTYFAGFTTSNNGDVVCKATTPVTADQCTITYRVSTDLSKSAGQYQTVVNYIVTPQY